MKKQRRRAPPPRPTPAPRAIVAPLPPVVDEADRQEVYDRSIAEFETDGVKDAESGGPDPERNFVEPSRQGPRGPGAENPKR